MFIGNILIGKPDSARQIELIQKKELKKLQIFSKHYRLDKSAEAILIMYPEGLENFLKAHLAKYKVFLSNNNLLFIYHIEKHPDLASEFIKNFSEYGGAEDGLYDVMEKFLEIADKFPEAQTAFQEMYQHFCDTIKSQFIDRILKNDKDEQILTFTSWYPEKMRLGDSNMLRFEEFVSRNSLETFKQYIDTDDKPLYEKQQLHLQKMKRWDCVNACILKHRKFLIEELPLFAEFLEYNRTDIEIVKVYLKHNELPKPFQHYLLEKRSWQLIKHYCQEHNDFVFSEPKGYCRYLEACMPKTGNYRVTETAEKGIFESEYEKVLLSCAQGNCILFRNHKIRFLKYYGRYPREVTEYIQKYGKELNLSEDEQINLLQNDSRFSLCLEGLCVRAEAFVLDPENRSFLFEYVEQRQFRNHENEFGFLMMYKHYPSEVEQYLVKYGKEIILNEDEQLKFVEQSKKALVYIKVSNPAVFKEYVLPEIRRQSRPWSADDVPVLIGISLENPMLLENFIQEHGKIAVEYEPELFFRAEEQIRDSYVKNFGIDFDELIRRAVQYGAAEADMSAIEQDLKELRRYYPQALRGRSKTLRDTPPQWYMGAASIPKEVCDFCKWYRNSQSCPRELDCNEVKNTKKRLLGHCSELAKRIVTSLYNISHLNYLTA